VTTDEPLARGIPPGSLRHYAVTYSHPDTRCALAAIYAFEAEIDDPVRTASHEVAHTRLQWWRSEVDALLAGQPRHPVTRALLSLPGQAHDDLPLLHEALVAADIDLARLVLRDARELEAYCFRAAGSLQTLAVVACSQPRPASAREREFARRLGSCMRRTERLRRDVAQELRDLPLLLQPAERRAQRHGLVLAALHRKLVDAIDHRREIARARAEVPAWTRLWTAWRTAVPYA